MVVFTCNHCGDSLHKPKVEKHYAFVCRTIKSLTCVDCFKDFRGEEYVSHVKCLTEDERYAAKGTYVNGNVKKGEVKQESWVEMIKTILNQETNIEPPCRKLLNIISTYNNIPRKSLNLCRDYNKRKLPGSHLKKKEEEKLAKLKEKKEEKNFIRSSFGGRVNLKDIEDIWNIIEKYKNNQSKNNGQTEVNKVDSKLEENSNDSNIASAIKNLKNEENETKKRKLSDEETKPDVPKKKKQKKVENHVNLEQNDEDLGGSKIFRYQDKILEILMVKGSMSLKKLQKKVLNAYLKETGETEVTPKMSKKFNKKLKKISNLEIADDRVTLLEIPN
ncbi:hypothetical protein NQ314_019950 [Rhamnusium bicolor]|uniref:Cell growth-regulating nucleolar protein n=1 Tax=Rhamnusium bicolor TaxID=1586634 RepID=A0AAV8WN41_9CUCU|nr:hypothetical protein NQ314_019950 [Rhamnusium bicolor]